jgi:hypothetical protein
MPRELIERRIDLGEQGWGQNTDSSSKPAAIRRTELKHHGVRIARKPVHGSAGTRIAAGNRTIGVVVNGIANTNGLFAANPSS